MRKTNCLKKIMKCQEAEFGVILHLANMSQTSSNPPSYTRFTNLSSAQTQASLTGRELSDSSTQENSEESSDIWVTPQHTLRSPRMSLSPSSIAQRMNHAYRIQQYLEPFQLSRNQDGGNILQTPNFGEINPTSCSDTIMESELTDEALEDIQLLEEHPEYGTFMDLLEQENREGQENWQITSSTPNQMATGGTDTGDRNASYSTTSTEMSITVTSLDGVRNFQSRSQSREPWWTSRQQNSYSPVTPSQWTYGEMSPIQEHFGEE